MVCKHGTAPRSIRRILAEDGDDLWGDGSKIYCKNTAEEWTREKLIVLFEKSSHGGLFCGLHDAR